MTVDAMVSSYVSANAGAAIRLADRAIGKKSFVT